MPFIGLSRRSRVGGGDQWGIWLQAAFGRGPDSGSAGTLLCLMQQQALMPKPQTTLQNAGDHPRPVWCRAIWCYAATRKGGVIVFLNSFQGRTTTYLDLVIVAGTHRCENSHRRGFILRRGRFECCRLLRSRWGGAKSAFEKKLRLIQPGPRLRF